MTFTALLITDDGGSVELVQVDAGSFDEAVESADMLTESREFDQAVLLNEAQLADLGKKLAAGLTSAAPQVY